MSPELSFHGQPFDAAAGTGAFLARVLADPAIDRVTVVVAWARYRGLGRLKAEIEAFRARGGVLTVVLGIDEGGATRPGLLGAVRLADAAHVFHDPGAVTFHPKLYLAEGAQRAVLRVGSSNATPGGLYANYEAALEASFALPAEADAPALRDARAYVARLLGDPDACRPLTEALVDDLVRDPRYLVAGDERRRGAAASPPGGSDFEEADERGSTDGPGGTPLFAPSRLRQRAMPELPADARAELAGMEIGGVPAPARPAGPAPGGALRWTKTLKRADAQRPGASAKTNPTGLLRLTKGPHPIDHRTWFRQQLFAAAPWVAGTDRRGNPIETAAIAMEVTLAGVAHGIVALTVDHAPHREEEQGNVTTILHWGPLATELRAVDFTGRDVVVERRADGTYALTIA